MVGESCDVFAIRVLVVQTFAVSCVKIQALLIYLSRYIPILTRRQRKNLFGLRVQQPLVTTILTTKGKGNPATYLPTTQRNNKRTCLFVFTLFL